MAKTKNPHVLQTKERVRAAVDMRGVPEGSDGKILLSVGLDWVRYWVQWDSGLQMGSVNRDNLVRVDEWETYLVDRELAAERALLADEPGAEETADTGGGGAADGAMVNGVLVPQLLLDRTTSALQRFGVSR